MASEASPTRRSTLLGLPEISSAELRRGKPTEKVKKKRGVWHGPSSTQGLNSERVVESSHPLRIRVHATLGAGRLGTAVPWYVPHAHVLAAGVLLDLWPAACVQRRCRRMHAPAQLPSTVSPPPLPPVIHRHASWHQPHTFTPATKRVTPAQNPELSPATQCQRLAKAAPKQNTHQSLAGVETPLTADPGPQIKQTVPLQFGAKPWNRVAQYDIVHSQPYARQQPRSALPRHTLTRTVHPSPPRGCFGRVCVPRGVCLTVAGRRCEPATRQSHVSNVCLLFWARLLHFFHVLLMLPPLRAEAPSLTLRSQPGRCLSACADLFVSATPTASCLLELCCPSSNLVLLCAPLPYAPSDPQSFVRRFGETLLSRRRERARSISRPDQR